MNDINQISHDIEYNKKEIKKNLNKVIACKTFKLSEKIKKGIKIVWNLKNLRENSRNTQQK